MPNEAEAGANPNQVINVCAAPSLVTPPGPFDFVPENWTKWKKRFQRYITVSDTVGRSEEEKIDLLLYLMGDQAEDLVLQLKISSQEATLEQVLQKIDSYFNPKKNTVYARYKFNSRAQQVGETVDEFVRSLHVLAEDCEFGELKDELIRDRIIVGLRSQKAREKMLLNINLTLEQALTLAKNVETYENTTFNTEEQNVHRISKEKEREKGHCWFCGRQGRHPSRNFCPAVRAACMKCKKIGHFARCCRANAISVEGATGWNKTEVYEVRLGMINSKYSANIDVYKDNKYICKLNFLIDTGADIVAIPERNVKSTTKLDPCTVSIKGPDDSKLTVLGVIQATLKYNDQEYSGDIFVVRNLKSPILGTPALERMNIIRIVGINNVGQYFEQSTVDVETEFPKIFDNLGVFKEPFNIKLCDSSKSYIQYTPRVVPIPLLEKVKSEIDRLCKLDVLVKVEEPTQYVSPMVVVPKDDNKIRICGDYTELNKNILRPVFPIPKVEVTLARLKGSKFYSKIDATSGFHQIRLTEESAPLTTIITPFGRYMYKRLPFGLNCAPEYFSMKFSELFHDLPGVVIHVDDILIYAEDIKTHDHLLRTVLNRLEEKGITINKNKCVFGVQEVKYLGHIINKQGIQPDQERIRAIKDFETPSNKKQVMQFLGMVNFVSRFIKNKTEILQPLYVLLREDTAFVWGRDQEIAFEKTKEILQKAPILAHFDPNKKIVLAADSSSYGLGATLMQESEKGRQIIAYASRTLSDTEKRYSQIEKECLALTWAVERFKDYVYGIKLYLETDHKPLIQILQTKHIDELTPRLMSFRMRLTRFNYVVQYIPGKKLTVPDALSRNPLSTLHEEQNLDNDSKSEVYVNTILKNIPLQDNILIKIKSEQERSETCKTIIQYTAVGWPRKIKLSENMKHYHQYRYDFSVAQGFLLYKSRLVIPESMQLEMLKRVHEGHLGITKCRNRAKQAVWWLGMSTQIERVIQNCPKCVEERKNVKEDLTMEATPDRPWQKVGIDLFNCGGNAWYMVIIDYYSRYLDIKKLANLTEIHIIDHCKDIFSKFGIPEIVRTDNGTQFKAKFREFAKEYNFQHITSSPYYSQSNGEAESAVKIAKRLLKKNDDIHLALLIYRNTPLDTGFSPAELLFNRKLRDNLPRVPSMLNKTVKCESEFKRKDMEKKIKVKSYYNKRHRTKQLGDLNINDRVWIVDLRAYGKVVNKCKEPRAYIVETDRGMYRRNRWHLIPAPFANCSQPSIQPVVSPNEYKNDDMSNRVAPNLDASLKETVDVTASQTMINNDAENDDSHFVSDSNNENNNCNDEKGDFRRRSDRYRRRPKWMEDYILHPTRSPANSFHSK